MTTPIDMAPFRPAVRPITTDDVCAAVAAGWADFKAAPQFGLLFGGVFALGGVLMYLVLAVWGASFWILPLAFAFPPIGPFVAIGLYEVSRRREAGLPLDWDAVLGAV